MFNVLQCFGGEWKVIQTFASYQTACRCAAQIDTRRNPATVRRASA